MIEESSEDVGPKQEENEQEGVGSEFLETTMGLI